MSYKVLLEPSGVGIFTEIHGLVVKELQLPVKLIITHPLRARQLLAAGKVDGLMVAVCGAKYDPVRAVFSEPYLTADRYIFTPHGSVPIINISQLSGKILGVVRGYPYDEVNEELALKINITLNPSNNLRASLAMLNQHRIQALISTAQEVYSVSQQLNIPMPSFDIKNPISSVKICYAYTDTPKGRKLARIFSTAIAEIKHNGSLEKLINRHVSSYIDQLPSDR